MGEVSPRIAIERPQGELGLAPRAYDSRIERPPRAPRQDPIVDNLDFRPDFQSFIMKGFEDLSDHKTLFWFLDSQLQIQHKISGIRK